MATELRVIKKYKKSLKTRKGIGSKRRFQQVIDTIQFEISRNFRKITIMFLIVIAFFGLSAYLTYTQEQRGWIGEDQTALDYIITFMALIHMIILIIAVSFGGSMLVVDFQEYTGNILFPKISRGRLLAGRFIAGLIISSVLISIFYGLIGIATYIKFAEIPKELWISMGWALLYMGMNLAFVMFFSSFMKRNSTVVVISLLFMLIIFDLILILLQFLTSVEPLFIPTYYGKIITACFNITLEQAVTVELDNDSFEMTSWNFPSTNSAIIGMLIFTFVFISLGYFFFKRRQNK